METQTELESLQNFVDCNNIPGITLHEHFENDKRRTTKKFFLCLNKISISPVLDFENMNHFIHGLSKGYNLIKL